MEPSAQRHCPHCGTPVAQRAETCLMCGAQLKEQKRKKFQLPQGELLWPLLLAAALALLWLWKPWQATEPQAMAPTTETATATPVPSATYVVAPTATPLYSPTPPPTATLPPNQTRHTVTSGQTVSSIAKRYGTTISAILKANNLKSNSILKIGQELIVPLPLADTPTPTPTLTPSPTPFVYTIKSGETLSVIAKRFNTTVEALMQVNNIADATRIRVGTKLTIVQPPDYSSSMAYETYEVEAGDTLISISNKYGMTVSQIKEVNGLKSNSLRIGQKLKIPVGTATPTATITPTPTLTPTPGPARPAPVLLAPADGALFEGADTTILLNWTSVGILSEDEWYVLRMRRTGDVAEQLPLVWTQATSWRLPGDLYAEGVEQKFSWQVSIMEHTGAKADGTWDGKAISPATETRTFFWK